MKRIGIGADPLALGVTLAVGTVGGIVADQVHLPLAFMMGALVATAAVALSRWRPLGRAMVLPNHVRVLVLPVIGVAIGGAFRPGLVQEAMGWWPTLAALLIYLPLAALIGIVVARRGGLGATEALYGSLPGGVVEAVQLAEEAGADARIVSVLHFVRIIVTIVGMSAIFALLTGASVGSGAGAVLPGSAHVLTLREMGILTALGVIGFAGARVLRLPAGPMLGPMVLSAIAHVGGYVDGVPPVWLVHLAQVVIGCGLGARFANLSGRVLARAIRLGLISALAVLGLAAAVAVAMAPVVGVPFTAMFLAYAPAGQTEMSLIALSLQLEVVFVTLHHLTRLVLTILFVRIWSTVAQRRGNGGAGTGTRSF